MKRLQTYGRNGMPVRQWTASDQKNSLVLKIPAYDMMHA